MVDIGHFWRFLGKGKPRHPPQPGHTIRDEHSTSLPCHRSRRAILRETPVVACASFGVGQSSGLRLRETVKLSARVRSRSWWTASEGPDVWRWEKTPSPGSEIPPPSPLTIGGCVFIRVPFFQNFLYTKSSFTFQRGLDEFEKFLANDRNALPTGNLAECEAFCPCNPRLANVD